MEKYKNFTETIELLTRAIDAMEKAQTRKEVEELELEAKSYFRALAMKFPYIQSDIHSYALKQASRIVRADAKRQ